MKKRMKYFLIRAGIAVTGFLAYALLKDETAAPTFVVAPKVVPETEAAALAEQTAEFINDNSLESNIMKKYEAEAAGINNDNVINNENVKIN